MATDILLDMQRQSTVFSRYLINRPPNAVAVQLYEEALEDAPGSLSARDKKILRFMLKYPLAIGPLDAALAITQPQSEIRRRIYILFSILETQPEYTHFFLSQKRQWWYWLAIFWVGVCAVVKLLVGLVLVKVVSR